MPWVGKVSYKGVHLTNIFYIEQHAARLPPWYKPAPAKYLVTQINVSLWSYIVFNNLSKHASSWQHKPDKQTDSGTKLGAASIPWILGVPGSRMVGNMHNFISFSGMKIPAFQSRQAFYCVLFYETSMVMHWLDSGWATKCDKPWSELMLT